jgi:hypothetical protein
MFTARSLLSSLIAVLLLFAAGAAGIAAQIEGDTWTSPTYGFSVSWAGTDWEPQPDAGFTALGPERLDRLVLVKGASVLYFEGATRYGGNLPACVAEEANLLATESGVSEIRPYVDNEGVQLVADGPDASAAAFTLTLEIGGQEVDLVDYVECRTLIPGEAVMIVTLVTDPVLFEQELASAQELIDTIALAEDLPLDPLAAYGGWLAAAAQQPSVAGPLTGELAFGPGTLSVERAGVDAPDFYARAEFANPELKTPAPWDFGLGFRDSGDDAQFRLVVDSEGAWFFKEALGSVIAAGTVADVDTSPTGSNVIEVVAVGDTGYFAFNERLVTELDLSARGEGGDVFVGAGFFTEDATAAGATAFSDFEIWSLSGLEAPTATAAVVEIGAEALAELSEQAIASAPLAGPLAGELVQAIGSAAIAPAGVEVQDFVAQATFVNPSNAAESPWDFGIAFREQESGDHFRVIVASDGTWEYQIGLQTDLAGGAVPSLNFEEGATNTLEVIAAGGSVGFSVNGLFVSELDATDLGGASDVWVGSGFHQANAVEGEVTRFQDFTVWPLDAAAIASAAATAAATPVAAGAAEQVTLRLDERGESGIDALAVLSEAARETTITVAARDAAGGEVVVVEAGTCDEAGTAPAFLLEDLDDVGRSETTIAAPLAELTDGAHAIAIHRSAEDYADVVACGDIPASA